MIPGTNTLDSQHIKQIFQPFDADEECVAWHYEKSGVFTIRGTYKLAADVKVEGNYVPSSSLNDASDRSPWDSIWKAKVPEKIRIFWWRVATKSLDTKQNKCKRTIVKDDVCDVC